MYQNAMCDRSLPKNELNMKMLYLTEIIKRDERCMSRNCASTTALVSNACLSVFFGPVRVNQTLVIAFSN